MVKWALSKFLLIENKELKRITVKNAENISKVWFL